MLFSKTHLANDSASESPTADITVVRDANFGESCSIESAEGVEIDLSFGRFMTRSANSTECGSSRELLA